MRSQLATLFVYLLCVWSRPTTLQAAADSRLQSRRAVSDDHQDDVPKPGDSVWRTLKLSQDETAWSTASESHGNVILDEFLAKNVADVGTQTSSGSPDDDLKLPTREQSVEEQDDLTLSEGCSCSKSNHHRRGVVDPQTSLQLDPSLVGPNLAQDGLTVSEVGQEASITSTNNYINWCSGQVITNGQQNMLGSCNPVPMGQIPPKWAMPSSKFMYPPNGSTIKANQTFTITLAVKNLDTGHFVSSTTNYYSAPQQVNAEGLIIAHSHVVVESLPFLSYTGLSDPTQFVFFKALNLPAQNNVLTALVTGGLPPGYYKVTSIATSSNHAPVLLPVAMRGSTEDVSYFTAE